VTLSSGRSGGVDIGIGFIALAAFPAMILGGLDSPLGSVVGGIIIGVSQTLTQGYQHEYFSWVGEGFYQVMPYVVMIVILLVRPYGLFGTPEVRRV
jgi:branched-chain amino acid transport system permease protein